MRNTQWAETEYRLATTMTVGFDQSDKTTSYYLAMSTGSEYLARGRSGTFTTNLLRWTGRSTH